MKQGARRGAVEIVLGTVFGQGLLVIAAPALTRMYGPGDFAILNAFTGIVSVGAVLATLRLDLAIPIAHDEKETKSVLWAGIYGSVVMAAILWLLGLVTSGLWVGDNKTMQGLLHDWWLVPFTIVAIAVFQLVSAVLIREQRYRDIGVRNVVQGIATTGTQLGFGVAGLQPVGLLLGMCLGRAAGLVSVVGRGRKAGPNGENATPAPKVDRHDLAAALRRFKRFPLVTTWAALFNNVGRYAPAFFFPLAYGPGPGGYVALVTRILGVPAAIVGQAVGQVFLGRGAAAQRESTNELPRLTWYAVQRLTLLGILPTLAVLVMPSDVFGWFFGSTWSEAGIYIKLLVPGYLAQFVASPISNVFNILERQGIAFWWETVRLIASVAVPLVVYLLGGSALAAVGAYSCVLVFSYVGVLVAAWLVLRHVET